MTPMQESVLAELRATVGLAAENSDEHGHVVVTTSTMATYRVWPSGTLTEFGSDWRDAEPETYKIVRFCFDEDSPENHKVMQSGLTLDEAQAHCRRDDTHGAGWFDGYERE